MTTSLWDIPGLRLEFPAGAGLDVRGSLTATETTFTAADPAQGWSGVSVPGGTLTLGAGSAVSGVGATVSRPAAVVVTAGGRATLDGATVLGTTGGAGLYVSGRNASASVVGATEIFGNAAGPGIRVDGGGSVFVNGDDVQIYGNAGGIRASGAGSLAVVNGAVIRDNTGPGVLATAGARADLLHFLSPRDGASAAPASTRPIRLTRNVGGLYASGTGKQPGGVVSTEAAYYCKQPPCYSPLGQNAFEQNNSGPAFDASARMSAQVLATYNYWGTDQLSLIEIDSDSSSAVLIDPILTDAPTASGTGALRTTRSDPPPTAGKGRVADGVQALITEADRAVQAEDSTLAATHLLAAWARGTTDDDRLAVAEAAGRTLEEVQPAALVAWAETAAASTGADRPWGRRALALSLSSQGRLSEAASVAQALADEDGAGTGEMAESHRARGLALRVGIAVAGRDSTGALGALSALADIDPDGAADALLSVAVAFPALDLSLSLGRIAAAPGAPESGKTTAAVAVGAAAPAPVALSVRPNPTAGAVHVSLVLAEASDVRVVVFDALGREVARLHEGPAPAGALDVSIGAEALPAGVYVVRAVVRVAAGASVAVRTVTVAR